jgi:hypothetical protein
VSTGIDISYTSEEENICFSYYHAFIFLSFLPNGLTTNLFKKMTKIWVWRHTPIILLNLEWQF